MDFGFNELGTMEMFALGGSKTHQGLTDLGFCKPLAKRNSPRADLGFGEPLGKRDSLSVDLGFYEPLAK